MTTLKNYTPPPSAPQTTEGVGITFAERSLDPGNVDDRSYLVGTTAMGKASSEDSWKNYNRIGEVRYSVARSARIAGYARLHAERINRVGETESVAEKGVVADIVDTMYGKFGGTRGLVERFYTLMKVTAEAYPIWVSENGIRDGMWFLSPHEIDSSSILGGRIDVSRPVKWITGRYESPEGGTNNFTRNVSNQDWIGRIWVPSKQYTDEVDSPMTALNDQCEMLHTLTQSIMGRLRQRFALAGLLLIPNEISDAAIPTPESPTQFSNDKVMNYLITIMTRNVTRHDQGMSQIPALLKGPADVLDKVRHIIFDTQIADTDIKLRAELINRILDGLDQQKQATTGGEDTSHWGMWAVSDEERRITVQPDLEAMCWGLTKMVLWRELLNRNWDPAKVRRWRVGYDLSRAAVKTNVAEDGRQAWDRGAVGHDFLRKSIGATDDDKMSDEEYVRWLGFQMKDPVLATYGLKGIEVATMPVRASSKTPGPSPDSPGDSPKAGPGVGDPGSPNDRDSDAPRSEEPG